MNGFNEYSEATIQAALFMHYLGTIAACAGSIIGSIIDFGNRCTRSPPRLLRIFFITPRNFVMPCALHPVQISVGAMPLLRAGVTVLPRADLKVEGTSSLPPLHANEFTPGSGGL